jgi:transposase
MRYRDSLSGPNQRGVDDRLRIETMVRIMSTGGRWRDLPSQFGP